jgi:homogentisate phytyltransferase/homogentisate geranylgeranyltransferase
MVAVSLMLGTAYSLPPMRLKRFPFWASFCIFTVRGIVVNLGLFLHFRQVLAVGQPGLQPLQWQAIQIPAVVWALTGFILVFTLAIALFKDIPDLEGDRYYNINTFTVRLGRPAIFRLTQVIVLACYLGMIVAGFSIPFINQPVWFGVHLLALIAFGLLSLRVDLTEKWAIARFYQFIWRLFFLEYLIVPIACLLH